MYFFITWESVTTLNTTELLDSVAREAGVAKSDAEILLNDFEHALRGAMCSFEPRGLLGHPTQRRQDLSELLQ